MWGFADGAQTERALAGVACRSDCGSGTAMRVLLAA